MKKTNIRSIRFSDELADLIDQQNGNTFTQKFENLITRCIWEQPQREEELERLDKAIAQKREQLRKIHAQIADLNYTLSELGPRVRSLESAIERSIERWEE